MAGQPQLDVVSLETIITNNHSGREDMPTLLYPNANLFFFPGEYLLYKYRILCALELLSLAQFTFPFGNLSLMRLCN